MSTATPQNAPLSPHTVMAPFLVDRHEAARLLSVSVRTLDQLVSDGKVPSKLMGGRRLFSPEALRRWALDEVFDQRESA